MRSWLPSRSPAESQGSRHSGARRRPLVIGHRGAKGHLPENTLPSIERAIELGADGIEIDVYRVGDALIVIHDETVDRTTNGHGPIERLTLDELRALDAGKGARIPLLEEVIACVAGRVLLDIELKGPDTARLAVEAIERTVREGTMRREEFIVSSFDHQQLKQVVALDERIATLPLLYGLPHDLAGAGSALGSGAVAPNVKHIPGPLLADAQARGLEVMVWTANEPATIARCAAAGAAAIISDFPERVVEQNRVSAEAPR